jgi:hypothetical protein
LQGGEDAGFTETGAHPVEITEYILDLAGFIEHQDESFLDLLPYGRRHIY